MSVFGKDVRLYYVGGLGDVPGEHRPRYIHSRGKTFVIPEIGGYLDVPQYYARDIIRRNRVATQNGVSDAFTLNEKLAARAKAGIQAIQTQEQQNFTITQLEAMLRKARREQGINEESDTSEVIENLQKQVEVPVSSPKVDETGLDDLDKFMKDEASDIPRVNPDAESEDKSAKKISKKEGDK